MATQGTKDRSGVTDRLFFEHPRSLGMSWAGHGVGQNIAKIAGKKSPLGESAPIAALGLEPFRKMIGLTRPSAHAFCADVKQMRGFGCRIGHASPHSTAALDQKRADTAAGELGGEDRSRSASADNRDRRSTVRFRSQANSPALARPLFAAPYDRTCE
jgi:hypothetical protein